MKSLFVVAALLLSPLSPSETEAPAVQEKSGPGIKKAPPEHVIDSSTGTRFESVIGVDGTTFRCLGAGVRKVLFFKAYAVTFCLENDKADKAIGSYVTRTHPGLEGDELRKALERDEKFFDHLASGEGDKLVIMKLVRDISRERIASAFRDSLGEVLPKDRVERLISTIPGDGKDGQQILLHSHGSVLVIDIAGDAKKVDDSLISKNLWRVWLGPDAVAPSLKGSIAETVSAMR